MKVRFGSSGVGSLRGSETAAIKGFPDTLTRIFNSQIRVSAYEQSPDVNISRIENSNQAANGPEAVIYNDLGLTAVLLVIP